MCFLNQKLLQFCALSSPQSPHPKIPSVPTTHPQIYWKDLLEENSPKAFPLANDLLSCSLSSLKKDPTSHGLWRQPFLLILEFFFHHPLSLYQTLASPYLLNHQQTCSWIYTLKITQPSLAPTFYSSSQYLHLVHFKELSTLTVANWVLPLALQPLLVQFSSVAQSCPNSLRPHEPQHARPPCPSPNSCPLSRWCHL